VKCVHQTPDRTIAHLLRGALEAEAIPAIVAGEHLAALQGELPVGASADYRVSILDDDQLPRATLLVRQWLEDRRIDARAPAWACRGCGELHEPHFRSCWRCGADAELG
jgi:Putative prokaryotic signal transducing protein